MLSLQVGLTVWVVLLQKTTNFIERITCINGKKGKGLGGSYRR